MNLPLIPFHAWRLVGPEAAESGQVFCLTPVWNILTAERLSLLIVAQSLSEDHQVLNVNLVWSSFSLIKVHKDIFPEAQSGMTVEW